MKKFLWLLICALIIIAVAIISATYNIKQANNDTLQLVHIFFRHGQRTVSLNYTYKNDPHLNEHYYPYSPGYMTTLGQRTMYNVGRALRERYNDFLGDVYYPPMLEALSSSIPRAVAAMQTVLTGLFPPSEKYKIVDELNWQPVIYDTLKFRDDDMIAFWGKCNEYLPTIVERYFTNEYVAQIDAQYSDLYKYISENSGDNITTLYQAGWFYSNIKAQIEFGLKVEEWTKTIYPEPLHTIYKEHWKALVQSEQGIRYAAGRLLEKMSSTFLDKQTHKLSLDKKIYLYSGHDYGVSALLAAFGVSHDYSLPYGSYIILELHKIEDEYLVKLFYVDYSDSSESTIKQIKKCDLFCPLNQFNEIIKLYLPNPNICLD